MAAAEKQPKATAVPTKELTRTLGMKEFINQYNNNSSQLQRPTKNKIIKSRNYGRQNKEYSLLQKKKINQSDNYIAASLIKMFSIQIFFQIYDIIFYFMIIDRNLRQ